MRYHRIDIHLHNQLTLLAQIAKISPVASIFLFFFLNSSTTLQLMPNLFWELFTFIAMRFYLLK